MSDFDTLGLSPTLMRALERAAFTEPTPIQFKAIPHALQGRDILGLAQTGTGKTLAFGLPLIDGLMAEGGLPAPKTAKALILAPTRELVNQIADSLRQFTEGTKIRVVTVVGGQSINRQIQLLARGTDILVATPGRLIDLMERRSIDLSAVRRLVLDEADQMLDMGFIHALRKIAPRLGSPRQTLLFSATMPGQMEEISRAYLTDPVRVQASPPGKAADKVVQSVHFMDKAAKPDALRDILSRDLDALTLVFARTKHGAEKLMKGLVADGYNAASIHGNKSQNQRDRAIQAFRDGTITILVATDVAARGIDIPGVAYVINYELPDTPDNYVHRIGRTARAGRDGEAIAFCSVEEAEMLRQIETLMKVEIPVAGGVAPSRQEARQAAKAVKAEKAAKMAERSQRRRKPARKPGAGKASGQKPQGQKPQGQKPQGQKSGAQNAASQGGASRPKRRRPRRARAA